MNLAVTFNIKDIKEKKKDKRQNKLFNLPVTKLYMTGNCQ